jgi:hypothetical protein
MKNLLPLLLLAMLFNGCLPLTANRTKGEPAICPIHHVAMTKARVDIGGIVDHGRDAAFPYAHYRAYAGCVPPQPMWARVYVCPECEQGYREKHGHNPY